MLIIFFLGVVVFVSSYGHLVVDGYGVSLKKRGRRVVVICGDEVREFAVKGIREIIVSGRASISSELLKALALSGVGVLITSFTGIPLARVVSARAGGTAKNRLMQYKALLNGCGCMVIKYLLLGKLRNQISNLRYYSRARRDIEEKELLYEKAEYVKELAGKLEDLEVGGDIGGCREEIMAIEAQAASIYWDGMKKVLGRYGFREN